MGTVVELVHGGPVRSTEKQYGGMWKKDHLSSLKPNQESQMPNSFPDPRGSH